MAPVTLLTCGVLVGGERGGAVAVFPRDASSKAGMVWHGPQPRPKQTLTRLGGKKEGKDGAAMWFAGIGSRSRERDDGKLAKCSSPRGDLVHPRGAEDGEARGGLGDTRG